jgi:purine nucleosidase
MVLGPLTNISIAYLLDNQLFDNLEQIVFMGGTVGCVGNVEPTVEFNVSRDPEACHIMLTNANCPLIFIPWECGLSNLLTWV